MPDDDLDDMSWYEDGDNEVVPPFDMFDRFIIDEDIHEVEHMARKPDSSLDPIREFVSTDQLNDLHAHFIGVWDKHHGF